MTVKLIFLVALLGASLSRGCQHLCAVDDEKLLCTWLCRADSGSVTLKFERGDTGCERESFLNCLEEDTFNDVCYAAGGCQAQFKFGSAF